MIQKIADTQVPKYEVLDYIITPSCSEVNTEVLVDGSTVVEMTCMFRQRSYNSPRFFSSNDTNTDTPGWKEPGTWGLQFEDSGNMLSIKVLGNTTLSDPVIRTNITYNDLSGNKYRYNLTAAGILNIYDTSDNVYKSYDVTQYTVASYVSSTPIKLFHRYASHEYINNATYVYDVKIWQNNELIKHYIPVKRLSDNVYGLYDLENETFHQNEISGYIFTGASKATPEYIYDNLSSTNYVNDIIINSTQINRIYFNGEVYWGALPHQQTPVYEVLDEIHPVQNSGSVYFNTNYLYKSNTTIDTQYECMSDVLTISGIYPRLYQSDTTPFYGAQVVAVSHEPDIHIKRNGYSNWDIFNNYGWTSGLRTLRQSQNEVSINGTVLWSGTQSYTNTTYPILLLNDGEHSQSSTGMFYIHYYKFYESSTLVHEYLPVKRLSDNEYGFYDSVTDTFLTNLGTGSVTGTSKSTPEYIYE